MDELKIDTVNRRGRDQDSLVVKVSMLHEFFQNLSDSVVATGLVGGKLGEFLVEHIDDKVSKHFFTIREKLVTVSLFYTETTKQKFLKKDLKFLKKKVKISWLISRISLTLWK